MISASRLAALASAVALAAQPTLASAQGVACVTEAEVSAIGIYSVPSMVRSLRTRCGTELSADGYLARRGDSLIGRYAALQDRVWPAARSGLMKVMASKAGGQLAGLEVIGRVPDESIRPLVDALIVQELAPNVAPKDCWKIERVVEALAPIDPEIAGTLLGTVAGVLQPKELPMCKASAR